MPTDERESKLLSPEEKAFIEQVAAHYAPPLMTPAQRAVFDRALEARLVRRARVSFSRPVTVLATACAALLIWLAVPYLSTHSPDGMKQPGPVVAAPEGTPPRGEANLLAYAYYSDEFYGEESEKEQESFLPDEYEALAVAFALPDA